MEELLEFLKSWHEELTNFKREIEEKNILAVAKHADRILAGWCSHFYRELFYVHDCVTQRHCFPRVSLYETLVESSTEHLSSVGLEWRVRGERARQILRNSIVDHDARVVTQFAMGSAVVQLFEKILMMLNTPMWLKVLEKNCLCPSCQKSRIVISSAAA